MIRRATDTARGHGRRGAPGSAVAALLLAFLLSWAGLAEAARILVVHSYHQGLPWTDGLQTGIGRVFAGSGEEHDLDIRYLDMARLGGGESREDVVRNFVRHMTGMPNGRPYDVVIVSDNDALEAVLHHRGEVAPATPVVFCGANNFSPAMIAGQADVTGVAETPSFDRTLTLARELRPETGKILVLAEDTATGRQNMAILRQQLENAPSGLEYEYSTATDIAFLEERLSRLTGEWAVLLMCRPFEADRLLSVKEAATRLSAAAPVPIFAAWDFWVGHGPVGGVAVSSEAQGEAAARMALRILGGERAEAIPVVMDSPNAPLLDQNALGRFGIPDKAVPCGAKVLHKVPSFYGQHRALVVSYGMLSLLGACVCLLLAFSVLGRRRAEASLKRQLIFTETLLQAMPIPVFYKDTEGRYLGCNRPFADLAGLSAAEVIGRTVRDVFPRGQAAAFEARDREIFGAGGVQSYDHRLETSHGVRDVVIHKALFFDENGRPSGIVGMMADVTGRRQAEERLALAIAGSNEGIWDWDRTTDQVYLSPRWKEIIGYADHELPNSLDEWKTRIHPEDLERVLAANDSFFSSDATHFVIEYRMRHKDGGYRWVLGRGTCLRDADGRPYRMAGSHADITSRKAMERELIDARDQALAASRSKSEFLANMSHEIRTPLNGVLGMLQLLEGMELSEEQKQYVHLAATAARRLTGLLSDILDLSRIESGRLNISERPFELRDLCAAIEGIFAHSTRRKNVRLEVSMADGLGGALMADDLRLRQILFNLVGNAVKFTSEGFVRVEISSLGADRARRERILFCVSDSGPGMDDAFLDRAFEPFVQAEKEYVREHQGAGLGLAIVKRLVHAMGGTLAIDNGKEGTTVCFCLPCGAAAAVGGTEVEPARAAVQPESRRVLLVEDDPVSSLAVRRLLEKMGHVVSTAENGRMALESLHAGEFDLVLMDVQMPVMDGLQATRLIRSDGALGARAGIPIIAMTAYAMSGDREKCLASGMDGYVSKPVSAAELRQIMAEAEASRADGAPGAWAFHGRSAPC